MNRSSFAKLSRESTKITISEFFERHQLKKYNFDPDYQRRGDVWDDEKQAFLIDSILKNYPMPPIFLHQEINTITGETMYNVIDGKQRLNAILKFIDNKIELPQDYDVGAFGDARLNGAKFGDLKNELQEFKMQFWRYILSVEYIENGEIDIINNVFDRLNRNGEPLEPQELRKAKYYDTIFLKTIEDLAKIVDWKKLGKVKINRMQDIEFISELVFLLLENEPMDASRREYIDDYYTKWSKNFENQKAVEIKKYFELCINFIESCDIDFDKHKIKGVSHFYALFGFAKKCIDNHIEAKSISKKLNEFYIILRNTSDLPKNVLEYKESMQSNTRSKGQRIHRIDALVNFCNA